MDRVLPGKNLPIALSIPGQRVPPSVHELSIVVILALFLTFGVEIFAREPVVLLTEGVQVLRLDELLTVIAITHGNLGEFLNLIRYPEQMRDNMRRFVVERPTDCWTEIRDLGHTLIKYLLQQNRFGTGDD